MTSLAVLLLASTAWPQAIRTELPVPVVPLIGSPSAAGALAIPTLSLSLLAGPALTPTPGALPAQGALEPLAPLPGFEAAPEALAVEGPGVSPDGEADPIGPVFDGSSRRAPEAPAVPAAPAPVPTSPEPKARWARQSKSAAGVLSEAPFLAVADEEDRAWIADVVAASGRSKTGRRVLRGIARLARERGRPLVVDVVPLQSAHGYFLYDTGIVRMDRQYRRGEPPSAAPTFVHELLHVLQREIGLPFDAFEMELEAHVVSLRVYRELGLKPPRRTFFGSSARRFEGPLEEYVKWLEKEYQGKKDNTGAIALIGSSLREYRDRLSKRLERGRRIMRRRVKELKQAEAVLAGMKASGQPPAEIRHYKLDDLAAARRRLHEKNLELRWLRRDLKLLSTPSGQRRYRSYVRSVMVMVRRFHRAEQARRGTR